MLPHFDFVKLVQLDQGRPWPKVRTSGTDRGRVWELSQNISERMAMRERLIILSVYGSELGTLELNETAMRYFLIWKSSDLPPIWLAPSGQTAEKTSLSFMWKCAASQADSQAKSGLVPYNSWFVVFGKVSLETLNSRSLAFRFFSQNVLFFIDTKVDRIG